MEKNLRLSTLLLIAVIFLSNISPSFAQVSPCDCASGTSCDGIAFADENTALATYDNIDDPTSLGCWDLRPNAIPADDGFTYEFCYEYTHNSSEPSFAVKATELLSLSSPCFAIRELDVYDMGSCGLKNSTVGVTQNFWPVYEAVQGNTYEICLEFTSSNQASCAGGFIEAACFIVTTDFTPCPRSAGNIQGAPNKELCVGQQATLETLDEQPDTSYPDVGWGIWLVEDPLSVYGGMPQPGPLPDDENMLDDANFLGLAGTGTVLNVTAFADGATYYFAPFIYNATNNTVDPGCSGISLGYTIYMTPDPCAAFVAVDLRIMLGPDMSNGLRPLLPATEPYTALGYDRAGNPGGETIDFNNIVFDHMVDWVLVELRDADDPGSILSTKALPLLSNGRIVDLDGENHPKINLDSQQDFVVAIRHRNHLSVISNQVQNSANSAVLLDFSTSDLEGQMDLGNGVYGFIPGSANGDDIIDAVDRSNVWNDRNRTGYLRADVNMDGTVDAVDRSIIWNNRNKVVVIP